MDVKRPARAIVWVSLAIAAAAWWALPSTARAVPSYARQTGMACSMCHSVFPHLTAFGMTFKASGYTFSTKEKITAAKAANAPLNLLEAVPLSLMFQAAYTRTDAEQPGTQSNDVQFPQQVSLFLAGAITQRIGSFLQVTYSQASDHVSMDNTDLRFADQAEIHGKPLVYGLYLNNNPTVEDLWNSTPAWGFPYASADIAPTPAGAALIDGGLAQQVAGLGAYGFWDSKYYIAATAYRSAQIGQPSPPNANSTNTIANVAPYWRLAWQYPWRQNWLELGTYGLYAQLYPNGVSGRTDDYTDIGVDFSSNFNLGKNLLRLYATAIFEHRKLNASFAAGNSANASDDLRTYRADAHYIFHGMTDLALSYFRIDGDSDSGLYAQDPNDPVNSSASGSPDSSGLIAQIAYFPWQNVRLSVQYTWYFKFNGGGSNYNGFGRNASDNNTLYVLAWLLW